MSLEPPGSEVRCGFCGEEARKVAAPGRQRAGGGDRAMFGQGTRICDKCLALCEEILAEEASS